MVKRRPPRKSALVQLVIPDDDYEVELQQGDISPKATSAEPCETAENRTLTTQNGDGEDDKIEQDEDEDEAAKAERDRLREEWEGFREEYYEIIDQLPLTLYRSFSLLRDLDDQVKEHHDELLPLIHAYVTLRKSLAPKPKSPDAALIPLPSEKLDDLSPPLTNGIGLNLTEHIADGQGEGPSTSRLNDTQEPGVQITLSTPEDPNPSPMPEDFTTANNNAPDSENMQISVPATPTSIAGSISTRPALRLPPNPFALSRSVSVLSLRAAANKAQEKPVPPSTREMLRRISLLTNQVVRTSEEKVGLATATYDSVDRHVRALDASIKTHEASLIFGLRPGTRPINGVQTSAEAAIYAAGEEATMGTLEEEDFTLGVGGAIGASSGSGQQGAAQPLVRPSKNRKRDRERERKREKRRLLEEARALAAAGSGGSPVGGTGQELPTVESVEPAVVNVEKSAVAALPKDMAVDPHEPRYCYCQNVSYGEMIGCDNTECTREWFHLPCVGLTEPPRGNKKWFCRDCETDNPKRKRKK